MRVGGGTAPSRGEDGVEWSEEVEKEVSLLGKRRSGLRSWRMVYLTTLGCFRAVAELTSVGFEGGALSQSPPQPNNPGSTRGTTTSVLRYPDHLMANCSSVSYSTSIYEALDLEMSYKVLYIWPCGCAACRWNLERAPTR